MDDRVVPTERFVVFIPPSPSLAVDPDSEHVYVAFQEGSNNDPDVRLWRSDDGGRTWAGLGVWLDMPAGVLAGELIGTDSPGFVQLSYDAGRHWQPSGIQVGSGSVTQQSTGGPVLATVVDGSGLATYYQSSDGRSWSRVVPPAVS